MIVDHISGLHPIVQALMATTFTWAVTALGASVVLVTRKVHQKLLDSMNGFAAGVMLAASYWSLLEPSIRLAAESSSTPWVSPTIGFVAGCSVLWMVDKVLPHLHPSLPLDAAEGIPTKWHRSVLLVLAITLHNIPEGLAVGVSFGAAASIGQTDGLAAAIALTIGIGLQNFPEGLAVAMPLRAEGMSRMRSFWYGQLSAVVEPIAGVAGVLAVLSIQAILPYALAFAAGAMIFVVVEELIPTSQRAGNTDLATVSTLAGFTIMMVLDVALG